MSGASNLPDPKQVLDAAKLAKVVALVKENQLLTALVLFVLWQAGAFLQAYEYSTGVMC